MTVDLDKLEALARAATPGPWFSADWNEDSGERMTTVETREPEDLRPGQSSIWPNGIRCERIAETEEGAKPREDAAFIAAANPATILALTAELRAARQAQPVAAGVQAATSPANIGGCPFCGKSGSCAANCAALAQAAPADLTDERAMFEAWITTALRKAYPHMHEESLQRKLWKHGDGDYMDLQTQHDWAVWQARAAVVAIPAPADKDMLYRAALLAVERMRGCAATYIEDHARDTYPGAIGLRPQDVATMWAQEIHSIDAQAYLDESIADLKAEAPTAPPAGAGAPSIDTPEFRELLDKVRYAESFSTGSLQERQKEETTAQNVLIAHIDAQLARQGAAPAQAEPVATYQGQVFSDRGSNVWHDLKEAAYRAFPAEHRRTLYATAPSHAGVAQADPCKKCDSDYCARCPYAAIQASSNTGSEG